MSKHPKIITRRSYLRHLSIAMVGLGALGFTSCASGQEKQAQSEGEPEDPEDKADALIKGSDLFKLSLAQWSLNRPIFGGELAAEDFAIKAAELGFSGLEYVNGFYAEGIHKAGNQLEAMKALGGRLLEKSEANGLENLLIMIDNEGDLAVKDKTARTLGVENHHKWVDLARQIGCHSIRINLFGEGTIEEQEDAAAESMRLLGEYGRDQGINIVVENHGGFSSDPNWVVRVLEKVNMDNCGTLPDFGNFCIRREGGERWGAPCVEEYPDIYQAVEMMMPYAKGVSAKSYDFDEAGNETKIDYHRMLKVVKDSGYTGYVGIEFEGEGDPEVGILKTKTLVEKALG